MASRMATTLWVLAVWIGLGALPANAQSFRVQCPTSTITHPDSTTTSNVNPLTNGNPYNGPTQFTRPTTGPAQWVVPSAGTVNGGIKCQQVSGGDGFATMGDGTQTFMFSFGPLSGLAEIANGHPGSQPPSVFNVPYPGSPNPFLQRGDPATSDGAMSGASPGSGGTAAAPFTWNGAVGLTPDIVQIVALSDLVAGALTSPATAPHCPAPTASTVTGYLFEPLGIPVGGLVTINQAPNGPGIPIASATVSANTVTITTSAPLSNGFTAGTTVTIAGVSSGYNGSFAITAVTSATTFTYTDTAAAGLAPGSGGTAATPIIGTTPIPSVFVGTFTVTCVDANVVSPEGFTQFAFQYTDAAAAGQGAQTALVGPTASTPPALDGHVDPRPIIDIGVMNGNIPGPLSEFDEDDEFFLTLTNVGMIQRPDLFEQHTIHFHGYPNASSFYDGVPDASVAINIGASFTYYYLAPDAGTYFWHCHITPPEHLQMGMVSQLHVRPRQDRVPSGGNLYTYLAYQNGGVSPATCPQCTTTVALPAAAPAADLRTVCNPGADILCSATMPAVNTGAVQGTDRLGNQQRYTYNDGDASTAYDVQYPLQMHGFDPNFHFVGMTFNPEIFVDMKDKYFLLNGRSYPDTVAAGPQASMTTDGQLHYSQPMPAIINIPFGGKALLRLVNLSVSEYHTLQSLGPRMKEVGFMAKLLRDQAGVNTEFYTNSITLGGGESLDVILDASDAGCGGIAGCSAQLYPAGSVFYLYTPQLDHLSNDAENFGGMMTEVHICQSVTGGNTFGNTCN